MPFTNKISLANESDGTSENKSYAYPGKRIALVIGNSNYLHGGKLFNPLNDAKSMKDVLEKLGFNVLEYEDCDQETMKRAIDNFGEKIKHCDVGLFYYSGHGVQVNGNNYLIPVDARLAQETDVEFDCVRADRVLSNMETAAVKTNILILDACRDNPFERSWHKGVHGRGLAFMDTPSGSIIAYATYPGKTASDGIQGSNGVYTAELLSNLETPNITIEEIFKKTRAAVLEKTGSKQNPQESTSLVGNFYFKKSIDFDRPKFEQKSNLQWEEKEFSAEEESAYENFYKEYGHVLSWDNANKYCSNLTHNNNSNWRLPDIDELYSLRGGNNKFINQNRRYWGNKVANDKEAFAISFTNGMAMKIDKKRSLYTICVTEADN